MGVRVCIQDGHICPKSSKHFFLVKEDLFDTSLIPFKVHSKLIKTLKCPSPRGVAFLFQLIHMNVLILVKND